MNVPIYFEFEHDHSAISISISRTVKLTFLPVKFGKVELGTLLLSVRRKVLGTLQFKQYHWQGKLEINSINCKLTLQVELKLLSVYIRAYAFKPSAPFSNLLHPVSFFKMSFSILILISFQF